MNREQDQELEDIMEDMADDLASDRRGEDPMRQNRPSSGTPSLQVFVAGSVAILLLVLVIAFFFRGENPSSKEAMDSLKARLDRIEKTLVRLEALEGRVGGLEKNSRHLRQSASETDGAIKSLNRKANQLNRGLKGLEKEVASVASKTKAIQSAQSKPVIPEGARYHVVQPKENLTWIAQKYGMTLQAICRLNKIKQDQVIKPGQRLLVTPSK
jgi:LysM repeat protein